MIGMTKLSYLVILQASFLGAGTHTCQTQDNFCNAKYYVEMMSEYLSMVLNTRPAIDEEYQDIHSNDYSITSTSNSHDVIDDYPNFHIIGYELNRSQTHSIPENETDCLLDFVEDKELSNRSRFGMRMTNVICLLNSSTSSTQHQNQPTSNE